MSENQQDWDAACLSLLLFHYRTAKQSSTGLTPLELMFGRNACLPVDLQTGAPLPEPEGSTTFVQQLRERQAIAKELVDAQVAESQRHQKENYNCKASPHHMHAF